jgi:hypothetical protein
MKRMLSTRRTVVIGGLFLCSIGLPRVTLAVTGCTNGQLQGFYNAQIASGNFMNVLNALNSSSVAAPSTTAQGFFGGPTGFGSGYASGTPGAAAAASPSAGTGSSSTGSTPLANLPGPQPGLGRLYFDGNGGIIGVSTGSQSLTNQSIGTYTVNTDCSATVKLNSGQNFTAVITSDGKHALIIESDSAGAGAVGTLDRQQAACISSQSAQSFAFSYFGAQQAPAASTGGSGSGSGSGGTGGTATTPTSTQFVPASAIGSLTLDGQGDFTMTEWVLSNGAIKTVTAAGTYAVSGDCTIKLTFDAKSLSSANASFLQVFRGFLVSGDTGLIVVQTDTNPVDMVPGQFIVQ